MGTAVRTYGPPARRAHVAKGPQDVLLAAIRLYLDGRPLDMSALAADLGIGRATLYRWVGNREELLALVIAECSEHTFRAAERQADGEGLDLVVDVVRRFMAAVAASRALAELTRREPLVFIRLAMSPGVIEERVAALIGELLEREADAGRLELPLPAPVLAGAIVRLGDAHLYAHLLGRGGPEIGVVTDVVTVLLGGRPTS